MQYLETKITKSLPPSASASESKALEEIIKSLEQSKAPVLIVDGGAARQDWGDQADALIEALKIPTFGTILGKGIANDESPYYHGTYSGVGSNPNAISAVSKADVILWLGNYPSDFNTYVRVPRPEADLLTRQLQGYVY